MKARNRTYTLTARFPGSGLCTILCHGYRDAVRLRRQWGGRINGGRVR